MIIIYNLLLQTKSDNKHSSTKQIVSQRNRSLGAIQVENLHVHLRGMATGYKKQNQLIFGNPEYKNILKILKISYNYDMLSKFCHRSLRNPENFYFVRHIAHI